MATIYCLNIETKNLKWFEKITDNKYKIDNTITIKHKLKWVDADFELLKDLSRGWDTIYSKNKIETEPHFHDSAECRIILSGFGTFFIPVENLLYIVDVSVGDYVYLEPKIVHWFTSKKHLRAARFFEGDIEHKERMKDIPHEIYRLRDECVNGLKITI